MTTLLEDPTRLIVAGVALEVILGLILLRTGRGVLLVAIGVVLLVVLAGVGLERVVVTERERVEAVFYAGAAALEANDRQAILALIDPSDDDTRKLMEWALRRVHFVRVKINELSIEVDDAADPPTARAHLIGIVGFNDRRGEYPYGTRPVDFTAELHRRDGRWLFTGHALKNDPRGR